MEAKTPSIIDLNAELAKLTMFRGRTPQSTTADRKGSAAQLASYRDGALLTSKFAGKGHCEAHPGAWGLPSVLSALGILFSIAFVCLLVPLALRETALTTQEASP
jgi:hypothetical protein